MELNEWNINCSTLGHVGVRALGRFVMTESETRIRIFLNYALMGVSEMFSTFDSHLATSRIIGKISHINRVLEAYQSWIEFGWFSWI